jgi:hypothetical protein
VCAIKPFSIGRSAEADNIGAKAPGEPKPGKSMHYLKVAQRRQSMREAIRTKAAKASAPFKQAGVPSILINEEGFGEAGAPSSQNMRGSFMQIAELIICVNAASIAPAFASSQGRSIRL